MQTLTKRRHLQATCNGFRLSATLAENPGLTSDKVRATGTPNLLPRYGLPTQPERLERFISCFGATSDIVASRQTASSNEIEGITWTSLSK